MHALALLVLLLVAPVARGQDVGPPIPTPPPPTDVGLASPRSTVRGFLTAARDGDWKAAATYLDLRKIPQARREAAGIELAEQLKTVIQRKLVIDLNTLSPEAAGFMDDGQPENRDLIGIIETDGDPVNLYVERMRAPDGALEWRIAGSTITALSELYEELESEPTLAAWLPSAFFSVRLFDTVLWQWIGIALLALTAALASFVIATAVIFVARTITRRTDASVDTAVVDQSVGPLRLILWTMLFSGGLYALLLPLSVHTVFSGIAKGLLAVAITWFILRVITVASRVIQLRMAARGDRVGISAVPLIRRVVNALVVLLAFLVVIGSLGVNITGVVAGLGVGGLAVALAAQKSLENLFGGLTLIADQPVHVGDFCRFGDRVGTIEDIGLRSTRIRTLDRTVVTVPNAEFSTLQIENYARRDRIWLSTTIGVRYETTPDQLRYLLVELKKMLVAHPKIDRDPARVRFAAFGAYSLDIDIFAYVRTTDYNEYLAVREDIYLRIMEIVAASGTGFAFPSQTVYTAPDDGLDEASSRKAETEVEAWRRERRLFLPTMPEGEETKIADTLSYPPEGAPDAPGRTPKVTGPTNAQGQ